jgi:ElaB/YqjD/DUF883 family membrane-anchored ribosome-binding protein
MKTDDRTHKDAEEFHAEESPRQGSADGESIVSAAEAANKASRAVRGTAQKYLDAAGIKVDWKDIEKRIRDRPLFYLGIAAGAGFVMGGGMATSRGLALLGLVGRKAAVDTATNFGRQVLRQAVGGVEAAASDAPLIE